MGFSGGLLDDTYSDGLSHISDGESSKRSIVLEWLDNHWLLWDELNHGSLLGLDELWLLFKDFTITLVDLGADLGELASNMGSVAIKDWSVSGVDLTWVVKNDDLSKEHFGIGSWVILGIGGDVTSLDVLNGDASDVKSNVVSWLGRFNLFVMHLNGFGFSSEGKRSERNNHTGLEGSSFNTTDWDSSDTTNFVNILEWESEWLLRWSLWWVEIVEGLEESWSLVPWHVVLSVLIFRSDHVITAPSRDWDEGNLGWVVSNLLEESFHLTFNFLVAGF